MTLEFVFFFFYTLHTINPKVLTQRLMKITVISCHLTECRQVAGEGAWAAGAPPRNVQIWIKFRYKSRILLTKMDSCQSKLYFPSIVNHSKIMYRCSSVQFGIVLRNEIVFLLS